MTPNHVLTLKPQTTFVLNFARAHGGEESLGSVRTFSTGCERLILLDTNTVFPP